jgi:DNA-binding HxlR family transcriptional regulator
LEEKCGIQNIWDVLGRRWSLLILKNLSSKNVVRFNELKRNRKDISNTVLSDRLSELEKEGLITKKYIQKYHLKLNID